jgi:PAS domain S-box-containing protein
MIGNGKLVEVLNSVLSESNISDQAPEEFKEIQGFSDLYSAIYTIREHFIQLSQGNINNKVEGKGYVFGALKSLQSSLRHLTWQTKRIAQGDFSQKVDFMGELSDEINAMALNLEIQWSIKEKVERELKDSRENFRKITENMEEVFWLCDREGKILYLSPSFETIWGAKRSSIATIENLLFDYTYDYDLRTVKNNYMEYLATEHFEYEFRVKLPDNAIKTLSVRLSTIKDENGNIERQAGIAQDVTEKVKSRDQLLAAYIETEKALNQLKESQNKIIELEQKNAVLAMTVTANHEINQPLTVLKGNLEILQERLDDQGHENLFVRMAQAIEKIEGTLSKLRNLDRVKLTNYVGGVDMIDLNLVKEKTK